MTKVRGGNVEQGLWDWLSAGVRWRLQYLMRKFALAPSSRLRSPGPLGNQPYDAPRYWAERHNAHRRGFRGVGHVDRSEDENIQDYVRATEAMTQLLRAVGCNPRGKRMLDVGCGNGFWAGAFREWGVAGYTGVDITDALFDLLRRRQPSFEFVCGDLRQLPLRAGFDLVTMIDVTQHIVDDTELRQMLTRARSLLSGNGVLVVTFWNQARRQENFYETFRLFDFYARALAGMVYTGPLPFRDKSVAAFYERGRTADPLAVESIPRGTTLKIVGEILAA